MNFTLNGCIKINRVIYYWGQRPRDDSFRSRGPSTRRAIYQESGYIKTD
jgi:hypothetical protein